MARPAWSARLTDGLRAAIRVAHSRVDGWIPAVRQDGEVRDRAHVTEVTGLVDLADYPVGTRVLVRREPLHPGVQQTFDDVDGHRLTALLTTQQDTDLAELDRRQPPELDCVSWFAALYVYVVVVLSLVASVRL